MGALGRDSALKAASQVTTPTRPPLGGPVCYLPSLGRHHRLDTWAWTHCRHWRCVLNSSPANISLALPRQSCDTTHPVLFRLHTLSLVPFGRTRYPSFTLDHQPCRRTQHTATLTATLEGLRTTGTMAVSGFPAWNATHPTLLDGQSQMTTQQGVTIPNPSTPFRSMIHSAPQTINSNPSIQCRPMIHSAPQAIIFSPSIQCRSMIHSAPQVINFSKTDGSKYLRTPQQGQRTPQPRDPGD